LTVQERRAQHAAALLPLALLRARFALWRNLSSCPPGNKFPTEKTNVNFAYCSRGLQRHIPPSFQPGPRGAGSMARAMAVPAYWAEDQKQKVRIVPPRCRMNAWASESWSECAKLPA